MDQYDNRRGQYVRQLREAAKALGPCTVAWLEQPGHVDSLEIDVAAGASVQDALLAEIFAQLQSHAGLRGEFFDYFARKLIPVASGLLSSALRSSMDEDDLVQSVLRTALEDLGELWFRSEAQFLALLKQHSRHKAIDRGKRARRQEAWTLSDSTAGGGALAVRDPASLTWEEELALLHSAVDELPPEQARATRLQLSSHSVAEIALDLAVSQRTAERYLERARERLSQIVAARIGHA